MLTRFSRTGIRLLAGALLATVAIVTPIATTANAATTTQATQAAVTAPATPTLGAQFHGMWSAYTDAQRNDVLAKLQAAGVTTVRLDVSWAMLQPTNATSYDPWGTSFVDSVIAMCNAHGITPLITLWLTPGWANANQGERVLPTNPADYARVAQWAAARYTNKVAGWEVWNEQNSTDFLVGANAVAYTNLLKAAYPAFHAGYPATTVVFGGVQYNDDAWIAQAYAAGAHGYFDVMATHPYMGVANLPPNTPDDGTPWVLTHAIAVRNLMVAYGDAAKPLWFTEFGWSSHTNPAGTASYALGVSEAVQAQYLTDTIALIRTTMPYVTRAYWYTERDSLSESGVQNQNYGLLRLDLSPKPIMTAVAAAGRPLTGVSVWRPANGTWYPLGAAPIQWGLSGDVPVPGDYNGDKVIDQAVWRPSTGTWYVRGGATTSWGLPGDIPVPADYNGDGRTDLAVWRPSNGTWYGFGVAAVQWGLTGDVPVPGDYNGDNIAEQAVWRPSTGTWYVRGGATTSWGLPGDIPVPADYNGDHRTDLVVWRPTGGTWFGRDLWTVQWGLNGDVPLPADFDGDSISDIAVYRPAAASYFIRPLTTVLWGQVGDIPLR